MNKIAVFSGTRSEYGILKKLLELIEKNQQVKLQLLVSSMHLSPEFGNTIELIIKDGFDPAATVEILLSSDTKIGTIKSIALGLLGISEKLTILEPNFLIVLGDRFESFSAGISAIHTTTILVHIHGGDQGQAIFDDYYRHSLTKLAQIHFVATLNSMKNVLLMGSNPNYVFLTGSPTQDEIIDNKPKSRRDIANQLNLDISKIWCITVFHPVIDSNESNIEFKTLINSLNELYEPLNLQIILLYPNADSGGRVLIDSIKKLESNRYWKIFKSLSRDIYISLMRESKFIIGNSSSGIIEAPIIGLPAINIGSRQKGRERGNNIIDVKPDKKLIIDAIKKSLGENKFTRELKLSPLSPYGDGNSSLRILNTLLKMPRDFNSYSTRFYNNIDLISKLDLIKDVNFKLFQERGINAKELIFLYNLD